MTSVAIILNQIMVMFFLMAIGFVAHKRDFLGKQTIQEILDLVIYLVTPALIMRSLQMEFTPDTLTNVYVMGVLALLTTILMMAVSRLVSPQSHLSQYAMIFGNTGFIGIPIVDSLYGAQSVVYMAVFIAVVNVLV
ncbi:AEC family transporter [Streptococcus hyovaginalis]